MARSSIRRGLEKGSCSRRDSTCDNTASSSVAAPTAPMTCRTRDRSGSANARSAARRRAAATGGTAPAHQSASDTTPATANSAAATGMSRDRSTGEAVPQAASDPAWTPARTSDAEQRQLLAQVHPGPQLAHRVLPRAHAARRSGREQPGRQGVFSRLRPRRAEQFEQRTAPEQVEVGAVQVGVIEETIAGFASSCPAVIQARQAQVVEVGGPLGPPARRDDAPVHEDQREEARCRDREPPGRHQVPAPRQPGQRRRGDDGREARVRDPAVQTRRAGSLGPPLSQPARVLRTRPGLFAHRRKYSRPGWPRPGPSRFRIGRRDAANHAPGHA